MGHCIQVDWGLACEIYSPSQSHPSQTLNSTHLVHEMAAFQLGPPTKPQAKYNHGYPLLHDSRLITRVFWPLKTLWMDSCWQPLNCWQLKAPLRVSKALSPVKLWWSTGVTSRKEATIKSCGKNTFFVYYFVFNKLCLQGQKLRTHTDKCIKEINPIRNLFYGYHDKWKGKLTLLTKTASATILVIDWPLTVTLECHALNEQTDQVC